MPSIPLPSPSTDELLLADWLELLALTSPDENASYVDLERVLHREGVFFSGDESSIDEGDASILEDEAIERKIQQVSHEIESRAIAAGNAYPFMLEPRSIALRSSRQDFVPYIFCLCLSVFGAQRATNAIRKMFEYLSCEAAKHFLNGEVIRFGSPRNTSEIPSRFDEAVSEICARLGEGQGYSLTSPLHRKDDGLDVVAWRDFPDRVAGKLILLGNCASGNDWNEKLGELNPLAFCSQWFAQAPASNAVMIKSFFVPRRIPAEEWRGVTLRAGIIFDRCRLAYCASMTPDFRDKQRLFEWTNEILNEFV